MFKKIKFFVISTIIIALVVSAISAIRNPARGGETWEEFRDKNPIYVAITNEINEAGLIKGQILRAKRWYIVEWKLKEDFNKIKKEISIFSAFIFNITLFHVWLNAFCLAAFMVLSPIILRCVNYWIIAPIVQKRGTLCLFENGKLTNGIISIKNVDEKNISVGVLPKESLTVIDEKIVSGYIDSPKLEKKMRWLYSWKYPIMSWFCELRTMTEYTNNSNDTLYVDITSNDPDEYFVEVDLKNSSGVFIIPSHIKAISPSLKINCKWRLFSLVAWLMMKPRYYIISGTGKIIMSAKGGFLKREIMDKKHRRNPNMLILANSNIKWDVVKTELWYNYIFAKTELFDLLMRGEGEYLTKNSIKKTQLILSSPESILNLIGKLLGF